jgi:hypothetical protein
MFTSMLMLEAATSLPASPPRGLWTGGSLMPEMFIAVVCLAAATAAVRTVVIASLAVIRAALQLLRALAAVLIVGALVVLMLYSPNSGSDRPSGRIGTVAAR